MPNAFLLVKIQHFQEQEFGLRPSLAGRNPNFRSSAGVAVDPSGNIYGRGVSKTGVSDLPLWIENNIPLTVTSSALDHRHPG